MKLQENSNITPKIETWSKIQQLPSPPSLPPAKKRRQEGGWDYEVFKGIHVIPHLHKQGLERYVDNLIYTRRSSDAT